MAGTPESINAVALKAAQQRVTSAANVSKHIDDKLAGADYAAADQAKLQKLKGDLGKATTETQSEIAARQSLQQAYDGSTYANKDADPAVVASRKNLAAVNKANAPVMHGKQNMVNGVCEPCLDKEVDSIMDCDTPYHVTSPYGDGPQYKACHDHTLGNYPGWDDLIKSNTKTPSEKNVLTAMSANEGDLDAVQAYDSQIVSVGAMQKTVNPGGQGELPTQLREFRDDPATKGVFDRVLGSKGYSVVQPILGKNKDGSTKYGNDTLYYTDPKTPNSSPITGSALSDLVKNNRGRWDDTLGPFRELGRTPEFQRKQVLDFNDRLTKSLNTTPNGYSHSIGDYVTSEQGSALVLDQDVNAPGNVPRNFGQALKQFYQANPKVSTDPTTWTAAERAGHETSIIENYTGLRQGTDMAGRAARLAGAGLSSNPGSLLFPTPGGH